MNRAADAMLRGQVVLAVGTTGEPARGIASGLVQRGATVGLVGGADVLDVATEIDRRPGRAVPIAARLDDRAGIDDAFTVALDALGHVDAVVLSLFPPAALEARPFDELDAGGWADACEQPLWSSVYVLQASFRALRERGGRICMVVPVLGQHGAAEHAPIAAAAEGQRTLAKSAGRQWGRHGITVNCVAVPLPGGHARAGLDDLVLGLPDPEADVAPVVGFLADASSHALTGATLTLDGGAWMSP